MKGAIQKQLKIYVTRNGRKSFVEWLEAIKNKNDRYRIKERLDRVALGNMGDCKRLSGGISELRLHFGPGYRIYFGEENNMIILLLCGGNKSTQKKNIKTAMSYWADYLLEEAS